LKNEATDLIENKGRGSGKVRNEATVGGQKTVDGSQGADPQRVSRRRFGRSAATVAVLSLAPQMLVAGPSDAREGVGAQAKAQGASPGLTPEQTAEVEAKLANIIRKYGSRLTDEQREHLRRILAHNEKMLASVRAFPLQNGDPAATVFRVSLAEESTAGRAHGDAAGKQPPRIGQAGAGREGEL